MTKSKRVLRVLFQACVISVTTLVFTEVAFRVHHYFRPSFIFYDPSYNRFRGKPHAPDYDFYLNSKGFKDVEFKKEKDPGTYRIVALGDSFAYGVVPYRYNYLTLLEEHLNREGKKNELLNMGIVATGPKDYLALLANEGLELKPDMVLVSFFIGNDFIREGGVRNKLYSYSYVATFIRYRKFTPTLSGLDLWLTYNRRVLDTLLPGDRIVTHYDAYFGNVGDELRRVLDFVGLRVSPEIIERSARIASRSLRHKRSSLASLRAANVSPEVINLYVALCEEANHLQPLNSYSFAP